jgi:hypothetical protein
MGISKTVVNLSQQIQGSAVGENRNADELVGAMDTARSGHAGDHEGRMPTPSRGHGTRSWQMEAE